MIKLIVLDVDGTLTDGGIYICSDGTEYKKFQAKDGLLIRCLFNMGIQTLILTGRKSELTETRAKDLMITHVLQNVAFKETALKDYSLLHGISLDKAAYIGDDLNDYTAMRLCGFKACPSDAAVEIKSIADYISPISGGHGAVRDIIENILKNTGRWDELLKVCFSVE